MPLFQNMVEGGEAQHTCVCWVQQALHVKARQ